MKTKKQSGLVTVPAKTIYFPTTGDADGAIHVAQKYLEAETTVKFLMVAIAKSGISLDSLDFPGTAALMKANAEEAARKGIETTYPGESIVKQCVMSIREARAQLDAIGAAMKLADAQAVEREASNEATVH